MGLEVQAAQTIRVDAALEVGNATESVTVTEAATLLKTESGELSQTVSTQTMDQLPLLQVGGDNSGVRNPYASAALLPGALAQGPNFNSLGLTVHINGNPGASETALIDGMDNTNIMAQESQQENAPGQDSIAEQTYQTSNYSAEYGQTGGTVVNMVMKSGTNQFHGSLYRVSGECRFERRSAVHKCRQRPIVAPSDDAQRLWLHCGRTGMDTQSLQWPQPHVFLFRLGAVHSG